MKKRPVRDALSDIIRGAQGNFDHLLGEARRIATEVNLLYEKIGDLVDSINETDIKAAEHTHATDANNPSGGDGGPIDHASLVDVTPNQHHAEVHALEGANHTDHVLDYVPLSIDGNAGGSGTQGPAGAPG